jgi:holin-like protein
MTTLRQLAILLGITYGSEIIVDFLNLTFPGSVLGMLLLFACLKTGLVRLEAVEGSGNFLLQHLPIMFVPFGVAIYQHFDLIRDYAGELALIILGTTVLVLMLTGWTVDAMKKRGSNHDMA